MRPSSCDPSMRSPRSQIRIRKSSSSFSATQGGSTGRGCYRRTVERRRWIIRSTSGRGPVTKTSWISPGNRSDPSAWPAQCFEEARRDERSLQALTFALGASRPASRAARARARSSWTSRRRRVGTAHDGSPSSPERRAAPPRVARTHRARQRSGGPNGSGADGRKRCGSGGGNGGSFGSPAARPPPSARRTGRTQASGSGDRNPTPCPSTRSPAERSLGQSYWWTFELPDSASKFGLAFTGGIQIDLTLDGTTMSVAPGTTSRSTRTRRTTCRSPHRDGGRAYVLVVTEQLAAGGAPRFDRRRVSSGTQRSRARA